MVLILLYFQVAVQKIEKDVILLLLTQGELSYQLGRNRYLVEIQWDLL